MESEYASREFALVFKDGAGDIALEHCKNGWCVGKPSREDENDENAMKRNQLIKEAEEDAKQFFRGKHTCDPLLLNKAVRNKSDPRLRMSSSTQRRRAYSLRRRGGIEWEHDEGFGVRGRPSERRRGDDLLAGVSPPAMGRRTKRNRRTQEKRSILPS